MEQCAGRPRRLLRLMLATVLALYACVPAPALAATGVQVRSDAASSAPRFVAQAVEIDLNAEWKAQEGGLSSTFIIGGGGTYYLSADLETGADLVVDAADADVVLRFDGHALTLNGSGSSAEKTMLSIVAARSVTLDGSSSEGVSEVKSAGDTDVWAIASSASGCAVQANDLTVTLSSKSVSQRYLSTHAVRIDGGTLSLDRCTVNMLMGNQLLKSTSLANDTGEAPSAVYATENTDSVVLSDCKVTGEGTQGLACDLNDTSSVGNAYALYSLAHSTTVAGGWYKAVSLLGNATCLYGTALGIEHGASGEPVALEAGAGQLATGLLSTAVGGVALNAPIDFAPASGYEGYAQAVAALRSQVGGGFAFGDCAPSDGQAYPAIVMLPKDDLTSANASGYVLGTFSIADADARAPVLAALENALGRGCSLGVNGLGQVCYSFDASSSDNAVAQVGSMLYPTLASAFDAFSDGDTLTLLADAGAITVADVNGATLDLNGHSISSLEYAASAEGNGLVVKNGSVSGTRSLSGSLAAVYQNSASPLVLSNVAVSAWGGDANVYGVYCAASKGAVTLDGGTEVDVAAFRTSSSAAAYGIGMPSSGTGSALVLDGAHVSASTGSAGVAVYGISCTNGATVTASSVTARGTTATTGAVYVLGALDATDSAFDAYTTGTSGSAYGFGIWGRSSSDTVVALDACTVKMRSAADVSTYPYACLLGATSESGSSLASWKLSGQSVLNSTSGMHLGFNVGDLALGDDFSLGAESDSQLVVSQAKRFADIAFAVDGAPTASQLEAFADMFAARSGSYYDRWSLAADADGSQLVWRVASAGSGVVSLVRGGGVLAGYSTVASALADAQSGDTLRLVRDVSESGTLDVGVDNLVLDLNGHELALRAGGVTAASSGTHDAMRYSGAGCLSIVGGTLGIEVGAPKEIVKAASVPYQGIAVTGTGTLSIGSDAAVSVSYVGSTDESAVNRSVVLRGIFVDGGKLELEGELSVSGAAQDGGLGAMSTCGVLSQSDAASAIAVARNAKVNVSAGSAPNVTNNAYYAETTYQATTNDGPKGLREIVVDPENDAGFYQDILDQFRISATYDDPNDSTQRNTFNASIYYANGMVIDHDGAWYDGIRIWAYTDPVDAGDVGKASSIVPTHLFTSSQYETLPEARGVATASNAPAGSTVSVQGSVNVACPHGNAYALYADGAGSWTCDGATLVATADDEVHLVAQGPFDLRDFIEFASEQTKTVVYPGTAAAQVVKFAPAAARDMVVGSDASFTLSGTESLSAEAVDAAHVEASSFDVAASFALNGEAGYSPTCLVANGDGANRQGDTFARGAAAAQAGLFEDTYRACTAQAVSDGVAWAGRAGRVVSFQIGDAVVARYGDPSSIDLAEPTAAAKRGDDQRQTYELVGWSTGADENAVAGCLPVEGSITPTESVVYRAVYATGLVNVPVTFANVFDSSGALQPDVTLIAEYGQSVTAALEAAHVELPQPCDYADSGVTYRFVGWYPYSSSDTSGALLYDSDKLADLDITLSVNGVSGAGLVLRAAYVAVLPGQHVITFKVDGYTSACVAEDGSRPFYTAANSTNPSYVSPAKQVAEVGKTYTFAQWFVDADGDGSLGEGEAAYAGILPRVEADAVYVADFSWEWSDVTLTFYVKFYDEATDSLNDSGVRVITTTYERETQDVADSVAKVGSMFGYGGKTYALLGWAVRKTDVDALYDASHPLPTVNGDDRALSSAYAKTYYGVYAVSDHAVNVSFLDSDGSLLGTANGVVAIGTSIDGAFAASGAATPTAKSEEEDFLGWATSASAASALDGPATMIESLVSYTDTELSLYAVYGVLPTYVMRLRNDDGSSVLYQVSVKRGSTIASALAAADVAVSMTPQAGRYFAGWYTAAGEFYGLGTPVSGSANLYAKYGDIAVSTEDADDISAAITLSSGLYSSLGLVDELSGVSLSIVPRGSADSPLRSTTASSGYTILKSYTVKLNAAYASGEARAQQGAFGTANVKVHVGSKYRNAKVRVFWLGLDGGNETVLKSAVKEIDDDGFISASIGNIETGDEDEGGNLCVAYVEGGKGGGTLKSDKASTKGSSSGKNRRSSGDSDGSGDASKTHSQPSGLGSGHGLGLGSRHGLGSPALRSSGSSSGPGSAASAGKPSSAPPGAGAASRGNADDAAVSDGEVADEGASVDEEEESMFADWESDAVVLIVLAAIAVAALLGGLWRLVVVRQRRNEADAELPSMSDQYANGVTF